MSSGHDNRDEDRPKFLTKLGRSLSFMNWFALVLVGIGLFALLLKRH